MFQKYYWYILLFACLLGCVNDQKQSKVAFKQTLQAATPIHINPDKVLESLDLADLVTEVKYIPLETNEDVIVGRVLNIRFEDRYLFVLDGKGNAVFAFDTLGNAIGQIGKYGKGLGEYGTPMDIRVNPFSHNLDIYSSNNPHKIMKYDSNFNYVDEVELVDGIDGFFPLDSQRYLLVKHQSVFGHEDLSYHVMTISQSSGQILERFLPYQMTFKPEQLSVNFWMRNIFSTTGNELSLFYHNGSAIYQAIGDTIVPKYRFEFEGYEFIGDELIPDEREDREKDIYQKGKICCIEPLIETEDYIFFTYRFEDFRGVSAIYSKKTNKLIQFRDYTNTFNDTYFLFPYGSYKGQLIFYASTEELINTIEKNKDYLIPEEAAKLEALTKDMRPFDNPVVILYTLKDF